MAQQHRDLPPAVAEILPPERPEAAAGEIGSAYRGVEDHPQARVKVDVAIGTPETVKSGIGDVRAWKITPTLPKEQSAGARRLTLWLSDDPRRLPVKMQAQLAVGTFDLTLRSVGK